MILTIAPYIQLLQLARVKSPYDASLKIALSLILSARTLVRLNPRTPDLKDIMRPRLRLTNFVIPILQFDDPVHLVLPPLGRPDPCR